MARPRKDGSPTAAERIETAFFDVLEATPLDRLTVSRVVEAAGVNRNSFYYHFSGLDDLAHSAVSNLLLPEVPRLLAAGFGPASERLDAVFEDAWGASGQLRRLRVVLGPHSNATLRALLKDAIVGLWLGTFELAPDDLDRETELTLHFALGGMLEVLGHVTSAPDLTRALAEARRMPVVEASTSVVMATLAAAAEAAGVARGQSPGVVDPIAGSADHGNVIHRSVSRHE